MSETGEPLIIKVPCYYCPDIQLRLFSPQDYARYHKQDPKYASMMGSSSWFTFNHQDSNLMDDVKLIYCGLDPESRLFYFYAEERRSKSQPSSKQAIRQPSCPCCSLSQNVHDARNINLTKAQKNLLLDHQRLGHLRMTKVQELYRCPDPSPSPSFIDDSSPSHCDPCLKAKEAGQLTCDPPKCATCEVAKARARPHHSKRTKPNPAVVEAVRAGDLSPGDCLSVDQYQSSVRGRLPQTRGRERRSSQWCGGTLFYDHASRKIFVRHQVTLSGADTVASKNEVERDALGCGVQIKKYHSDNGIFDKNEFTEALADDMQKLERSAVGAKFQNGVAERAIGITQNMARAMLLHVRIHWEDEFDAALWPFALDYAVWIYNNTPQSELANLCPEEIFSSSKGNCSILRRARVFGCPSFVLEPKLQDGKKIPKWNPRAYAGMFLGFSSEHSSTVGLIMSLKTGYISPQFHVVYDERFETVTSDMTVDLSETWLDLWENSRDFYLEEWDITVDGPWPALNLHHFGDPENEDGSDNQGENNIPPVVPRGTGYFDVEEAPPQQTDTQQQHLPQEENQQSVVTPRQRREEPEPRPQSEPPQRRNNDQQRLPPIPEDRQEVPFVSPRPNQQQQQLEPQTSPTLPYDGTPSNRQQSRPQVDELDSPRRQLFDNCSVQMHSETSEREPNDDIDVTEEDLQDSDEKDPSPTKRTRSGSSYKCSKCHKKPSIFRSVKSRLFSHVRTITDAKNVIYATLNWESVTDDPKYQYFHALFSKFVDRQTKELLDPDAAIHPFSLAAKLENEDYPSYRDIMRMDAEERNKWFDSMDEELTALFKSGACEFVNKDDVIKAKHEIVKTTWAFRKKRKPGTGEVTRYKSRLCVRGDLQRATGGYSPNETFAPVVEWMTVRLLFTIGLVEGWSTASIDFKNAFTQASLPEPIYLDMPPGFLTANPEYKDKLIRVKTSLYGERRAANLWYKKIAKTLVDDMNFEVSSMDPCLFIRKDCILVLYVDDAILMARNETALSSILQDLKNHGYDFSRDGDFNSYLGVQIDKLANGAMKMSQPHLARTLLDATGMNDSNPAETPITGPLFRHMESEPFDRTFHYRSAIGILQYLGNNTRPDCSFAINSCARFCIEPKEPHGAAVKRIARYIKGTLDEGLIIKPDLKNLSLDCHVDADYAGNWNLADPEDPSGVRSRTGFLLTFAGVPLLWKSVLQSCTALSTMESEYIALSTAMRSLVYMRALLLELCSKFDLAYIDKISTISTVFEDNRAAKILATTDPPRLTPRSKSLAVKYHWFRSHLGVKNNCGIIIEDVASSLNKADFLTKALSRDLYRTNRLSVCGW